MVKGGAERDRMFFVNLGGKIRKEYILAVLLNPGFSRHPLNLLATMRMTPFSSVEGEGAKGRPGKNQNPFILPVSFNVQFPIKRILLNDYSFFPSAMPAPIASAPRTGKTLIGVFVADGWGDCSCTAEAIDWLSPDVTTLSGVVAEETATVLPRLYAMSAYVPEPLIPAVIALS